MMADPLFRVEIRLYATDDLATTSEAKRLHEQYDKSFFLIFDF